MDISAVFFKVNSKIYWLIIQFFSALIMRPVIVLKGINLGSKSKFYGLMTMVRYADSKIIIGDNVKFRSISNSNLIGINRRCIISTNLSEANLIIGNNCGFSGTIIGAFKEIHIGESVRCGANTTITDSDWHLDDPRSGQPRPIRIEDNVWLGVNVIVLKGVTIGKNSVIGANSVVTSNIPENVIAAGNPCKVIKKLVNEKG